MLGTRPERFARHDRVDQRLNQSSIESFALIDLGDRGPSGLGIGNGGVTAGIVDQEYSLGSLYQCVANGCFDDVFVHPGLDDSENAENHRAG